MTKGLYSNSSCARYSTGDYVSSLDQLQFNIKGGHQNNAYVAYVDYSRDYNPPSATAGQKLSSASPVTAATTAANSANTSYGGSNQQLYSTPGMYATDGHGNKHLTQDNGLPIMQNNLNMMQQNHLLSELPPSLSLNPVCVARSLTKSMSIPSRLSLSAQQTTRT